jgi:hypothetical protein
MFSGILRVVVNRTDGKMSSTLTLKESIKPWAKRIGLEGALKTSFVQGRMFGERVKFLFQGRPKPSSSIVLASSGRSGSTWLADMLSSLSGVQQIFEPLHPRFRRDVQNLTGWLGGEPQTQSFYLCQGDDHPDWEQFLRKMLTGCVRTYWTDYTRTSYFPDRYLIKVIRANLMLGFISRKFQPKIIYLVRHPCAVVYSRLKVKWQANVRDILDQPGLVADYLQPWVHAIERERDALGAHAVWWAVENLIPVRELAERPHFLLFYERLCLEPVVQLKELLAWLDIPNEGVPPEKVNLPSRMSRPDVSYESTIDRLATWKRQLSRRDQHCVLDWAHRFGLSWYDDSLSPVGRSHNEHLYRPT